MPRKSPSRRDFLETTTAVAAAVFMNREAPMFLGSGDYVYRMDHHWAKVPAGKRFGYTHGVVEDQQGRFFIANQSRDAVMIFDHDGNCLSSWGQGSPPAIAASTTSTSAPMYMLRVMTEIVAGRRPSRFGDRSGLVIGPMVSPGEQATSRPRQPAWRNGAGTAGRTAWAS